MCRVPRAWLTDGVWLFLALSGFAVAAAGQTPQTGEIRGRVVTPTEVPLPGTEIRLAGDSLAAISDSGGRFVLRRIRSGEHLIRVRRIGYMPQYLAATLAPGEAKDVTIVLSPGAYQLPEIEVTARLAKPIEYAWTTKYDEFFRRQRVGLGYYISRKDIDRKGAVSTAELLRGVPGLWVKFGAPGLVPDAVWATRCKNLSVWIDGWELPPSGAVSETEWHPRGPPK